MSHDKWYSKGEVLSDLGEVSGRYGGGGGRLRHVTDRPPAIAAGNDDEMEELMRRFGRSNSIHTEDGPDLTYISNLILQARQHDGHVPDYRDPQARDIIEPEVLVLSKPRHLNPYVPEFQPRPACNSLTNPNTVISNEISLNVDSSTNNASKHIQNDVERAAEVLKETIIAPAANNVESKVKRNAALMSLMRLYATQSPRPVQEAPVCTGEAKLPTVVKPEAEEKIDEVSPQQIEQSIRKVDSWLSGPAKEAIPEVKPRTPYKVQMKPMTYKRREKSLASGCETPRSGVSSCSNQSPASGSKKYGTERALSKHAQELCEEFEKQREKLQIEEARDKTLWGYIERSMHENKHAKS